MPNTPKGLTYPSSSSPVAVPADIQELATDVDGLIVPNTGGTYTGSVSFTQSPSVPTPTSGLHAVNKTYADAINTDVTALETELGSNPSGTFSTVADRLNTQDHPASTTDNTVARYDGTQGKLQTSTVVIDDNGRLTTVTGATGGYGFVGGAVHLTGTGSPESVVSAPPGSTFLQTDSVVDVKGWLRWIKASGTGNTGWVAGPEADTGLRDVAAIIDADWAPHALAGYLSLRRIGQTVTLVGRLERVTASGTRSDMDPVVTVPTGFVPQQGSRAIGQAVYIVSAGAANIGYLGDLATAARMDVIIPSGGTWAAGDGVGIEASWITADAWPSVLPGSAA